MSRTVAAYATRVLLGAVTGVVVTRALQPEGRGSYYLVVAVASTATVVGHLSLSQANIAYWATDRSAIPKNNLVAGPILGAAAAVLAWVVVDALGPDIVAVPDVVLLLVALASVPIAVTSVHLDSVVLLLGRIDLFNLSLVLAAVVQCGTLIALAVSGHATVAAVVWVWAGSTAVSLLVSMIGLRREFVRSDLRLVRRMLGLATRYHVSVAATFLLLRIDILMLGGMAPASAVGLYSLAVSVGEMTHIGSDALGRVVLPGQATQHLKPAGDLTAASIRASLVMAGTVIGALCLAAPFIVPLLYGAAFAGSVPVLFALAPGLLAFASTRSIGPYLMRLRRPWLLSGAAMLALGTNVGLNLLLVPKWGIVGCAVATSAGYLTLAACHVGWFSRAARQPLLALLPRGRDIAVMWGQLRDLVRRSHSGADTECSPSTEIPPIVPDTGRSDLVSVITPTYNRAGTLAAAFASLLRQPGVLEWVVVDDGSTDGTKELIESLAGRAPFQVRYLRQEHRGKHAAVNRGVAAARGALVALLDSDDVLLPGAVDQLLTHWRTIGDVTGYIGVCGLDVDVSGRLVGHRYPADVIDATWQEMVYRRRITGDKWGLMRTDVLRTFPYRDEGNFVVEGEVWRQIGLQYRTRYVNVPVLECRTAEPDRLTTRPFHEIAAGMVRWHELVLTEDIRWFRHHPKAFVRSAAHLVRGWLHLGIPVVRQPARLAGWPARLLWAACLPVGWSLYQRDRGRRFAVRARRTGRPRTQDEGGRG